MDKMIKWMYMCGILWGKKGSCAVCVADKEYNESLTPAEFTA
jgi:hypothetical protein